MADTSLGPGRGAVRAFLDRWLLPYIPYPHFMALAPLDVVLRLLYRPFAWIPPPYWPRLALLLILSVLATIVSLPERIVLCIWLRLRPPRIEPHRAPVFVLGHSRSGTTFLQTLLAGDPMMRSPRWAEVLAPQGFVLLWTALRYLLIPFLPLTRIEEVVPLGATLPAEDEFALNNWNVVSLLAGRAVLPQAQPFYDRFHDLDALSPAELARWRHYQLRFVQKLTLVSRKRRLVLKSPGHMARVRYLRQLFPGAKFVHISRPPARVFQSNLLLHHTLQSVFGLQYPLRGDAQEDLALREYLTAEERYLADRAMIPPGDLVEVRLQDLAADTVGELKRIYRELGLPWSAAYEARLPQVLAMQAERTPNVHPDLTEAQQARVAQLEMLAATFGHDRPTIPKVTLPVPQFASRDAWAGVLRGAGSMFACLVIAYSVDPYLFHEHAILAWPSGVVIGYAVKGAERSRSTGMGIYAAALTLTVLFALFALDSIADRIAANWALIPHVIGDIFTSDGFFWGAVGAAIGFWIASGRPA